MLCSVDANVYLGLFGEKARVERRHLKETVEKTRDMFEKGSVDRFQFRARDVGKVR
jgi:hypothetical protein